MMSSAEIIAADSSAWIDALQLCEGHDVYHLAQYHLLAEKMGEGKPYLFFFAHKGVYAALPFLLRPVAEVKGLETSECNDITSVYGYPGIVTSIRKNDKNAAEFREIFQEKLNTLFKELRVVSFFSRTNPLLPNTWMLEDIAEIAPLSTTIAIDLKKNDKEQLGQMTKGHKYDIRKARKNGVFVEEDKSFKFIDDFTQIYNETMNRNMADETYFFPKDYYQRLKKFFGGSIKLYFAKLDERPISASMFFFEGKIIQYHLSGSLAEFFKLNGAKLILDEVRRFGTQNDYSWLHLGGGVGSSEDSLFRFKAGFSKVRLPFYIAKKIVDHEIYNELYRKRMKWAKENNYVWPQKIFFPDYRKQPLRMS